MSENARELPSSGTTRLNALIVEDSATDADLIVRELQRQGYAVKWHRVETADAMRRALIERPWDIVLSDHSMPRFNSVAALEILQASGSDLPFLIISGTLGEESAVAAMRAGADDLLLKDRLERLGSAVARSLREAEERRRRAEAEESLHESRALLHSIIEGTTDAIYVKDLLGRYLLINGAAERAVGKRSAEVLGADDRFLFPPNEAASVMEGDRKVIASGVTATYEETVTVADGRMVTYMATKGPLYDAGGTAVGMFGVSRDITERKQAEEQLRILAQLADLAPVSIMVHDLAGKFRYVNQKACALHGYSREELLALTVGDLDVPVSAAKYEERVCLIAEQGSGFFEVEHFRKDRTTFPLEVHVKATEWDGEKVLLSVANDITERRRVEAEKAALQSQLLQAQKMESVGRLAGGVAHEFNNMLTVILGTVDLAVSNLREGDPLRADLDEIHHAGERAAALTQQLLAFSRKQMIVPEILDLNVSIAGMRRMLTRLIGEQIVVVVAPDPELGRIRADPGQLEQVILNLAVNARDAMPGGGTLTIATRNVEFRAGEAAPFATAKAGPHVLLTVRDTGAGMDERTRARVFEPFFTTREQGMNKGLGLATVYGIIDQNGGGITVDSEVGKGTTWSIYLPRVDAADATADAASSRAAGTTRETILVVEDEASLLRLTTRVLQQAGYSVLTARHGEAAQRVLREHEGPVHLMLSDVVMPGLSGNDLAARMAELRPDMKILFTSGYTDEVVVQHGVSNASAHFLSKPFSTEVLLAKIREVLESRDGR